MNRTEIILKTNEIIQTKIRTGINLEDYDIAEPSLIERYQLNSIEMVVLMVELEKQLGIVLSNMNEFVSNMESEDKFADYILEKVQGE